jgi:hypothetical protein
VYIWYHPENTAPRWPLPELEELGDPNWTRARRAPPRARARGRPPGTGCRAWARSAARRRAWRSRRGCTAAPWGSLRALAPS